MFQQCDLLDKDTVEETPSHWRLDTVRQRLDLNGYEMVVAGCGRMIDTL